MTERAKKRNYIVPFLTASVRRAGLYVLSCLLAVWMVDSAVISAQRARQDDRVAPSTELMIMRESSANARALSEVQADLAVVKMTAEDARDEVREMRRAVWGMAATILISLFLQLAQMRKGRGAA